MRLEIHGVADGFEQALRNAFAAVDQARPDVCVVGTGARPAVGFLEIGQSQWTSEIDALADACFAAQAFAASARDGGRAGRMIFVSHLAAVRPIQGEALSGIAGAFLSTIARVAAVELGSQQITANVVVPGWTKDSAPGDVVGDVPAGRYATWEELAQVCVFLASPAAAYVNGTSIVADGGYTITKGAGPGPFPDRW